ncbi:MAG TPA: lysophospholipid acyltransferase family protein [Candidatus Nitrosotalea sp.]|nr:lysophospholipid acyltransferase family protein [Candidatus Nitrosotalea sp.]
MPSGPLSDLDLMRRGWRWGRPRPASWPAAAPGAPDRASNLGWARAEPVRSLRFLIQRGLLLPFTRLMADPEVVGSEWVRDLEQPAILASNHVSHADTHLLLYALSQRTRERTVVAAAADYWYRRPWLGRLVSLGLNTFPFSRTGGPSAVLHSSSDLLRSGWNLLVFPEGTRSPDGSLQEFRPGVGHLATETKAPVIPMHVSGSHRIMPKGQRLPLPAPARITIGRPLKPAPAEGSRAFAARVEAAVTELAQGSTDSAVRGTWIERWRATAPRPRPPR